MTSFSIPADLPYQPAVVAANHTQPGAFDLLMRAMCYCAVSSPGGYIPEGMMTQFGTPDLEACRDALADEGVLVRSNRGWNIDARYWDAEKNLSAGATDKLDRKKWMDREYVKWRRARDRGEEYARQPWPGAVGGSAASDSVVRQSAEPSYDGSRRSRAGGVGGEDQNHPPKSPRGGSQRAAGTRSRRPAGAAAGVLWPAAVENLDQGRGEGDSSSSAALLETLITQVLAARAQADPDHDWTAAKVRKALTSPKVQKHPIAVITRVALEVTRDPETSHPNRIPAVIDIWATVPAGSDGDQGAARRLPWCRQCDEQTRFVDPLADHPVKCPECGGAPAAPAKAAAF